MNSPKTKPIHRRYDYGYYLDRLATMQPKLLQLVHFDVRIHDMAISEW